MRRAQPDLFNDHAPASAWPEGLRHTADLISAEQESRLIEAFAGLPFKPFEFHQYFGKRRIVSFGWRYDYGRRALDPAEPIPDDLLALRELAAAFAGLPASRLRQVMVTEYAPGAGIGWHRDKAVFEEVIGVSLKSACRLRFRRPLPGGGWERAELEPQPRSAYLLQGPARGEWLHSIPAVKKMRYSVTFRRYLGGGA